MNNNFTEWLSKEDDFSFEDGNSLIKSQLNQYIDRIMGLLINLSNAEKKELLKPFIKAIKERACEKI